jgi:hypothetical protein
MSCLVLARNMSLSCLVHVWCMHCLVLARNMSLVLANKAACLALPPTRPPRLILCLLARLILCLLARLILCLLAPLILLSASASVLGKAYCCLSLIATVIRLIAASLLSLPLCPRKR